MAFRLQTATILPSTDSSWTFLMRGGDIVAIKKRYTNSHSTELHVLSGAHRYQRYNLETGTGLHETDDNWAFAMRGDDLVAIKKRNTHTARTEVHILSAASGYRQFVLQTGTALHETDGTWDFVMRGADLVAIKKSNTGTHTTEVHILSGASSYQQFILQTGTALGETDGTWDFVMMGNDLIALRKSTTASCSTEVHRLSGASSYRQYNLETATVLPETGANWEFGALGSELVAIQKSGAEMNRTWAHILDLQPFATVPVPFNPPAQELAFDMSECIFGWRAAFRQQGTRVTVKIRLIFDTSINTGQQFALKSAWRTGILAEWSNRYSCCFVPCCGSRGPVTFDVQWVDVAGSEHHIVFVRPGPAGSNAYLWDTADTGAEAAHEFGHLIGFVDEYSDWHCPERNPVNTGTVMDDKSGMVPRLIEPFCRRHNLRTSTL